VTPAMALGVAACGAIGAAARFLVHAAVAARTGEGFPYGTLVVNLSGSFALGLLVGAAASADVTRLLGTGLLGGYTTFSTWMVETERTDHHGDRRGAVANVVVSLVCGVLAAWLGRTLA
jgi:fluoride exporter